jgi:hypothetical protein
MEGSVCWCTKSVDVSHAVRTSESLTVRREDVIGGSDYWARHDDGVVFSNNLKMLGEEQRRVHSNKVFAIKREALRMAISSYPRFAGIRPLTPLSASSSRL